MSVRENSIQNCKIFAALHEDTDKGWVWLSLGNAFTSRMTVKILRGGKSVYCEYRKLDDNFVNVYNRQECTKQIDAGRYSDVVVISDWYRKALGGLETNETGATLTVRKPLMPLWADLRAACQHPEPGARVATRIAIWGTWLGFVGLFPAVLEMEPIKHWLECHLPYPLLCTWLPAAASLALLSLAASRGIKPR